jgi:hypothetical protein
MAAGMGNCAGDKTREPQSRRESRHCGLTIPPRSQYINYLVS